MKHSYFCRESEFIALKSFTFKKCSITLSFFKVDDVYFVEICRFSKLDCSYCTSRSFECVGINYCTSVSVFLTVVRRYRHYDALQHDKKLCFFEKYL